MRLHLKNSFKTEIAESDTFTIKISLTNIEMLSNLWLQKHHMIITLQYLQVKKYDHAKLVITHSTKTPVNDFDIQVNESCFKYFVFVPLQTLLQTNMCLSMLPQHLVIPSTTT